MAEKIDAIKEELTATPTEALEAFVELAMRHLCFFACF